jgi:hypothetical protein
MNENTVAPYKVHGTQGPAHLVSEGGSSGGRCRTDMSVVLGFAARDPVVLYRLLVSSPYLDKLDCIM